MLAIRKISIISSVIILLFGFTCEEKEDEKKIPAKFEFPEDTDLVLVVDAVYNLSHGYGHMFRCPVKKVVKGECIDDTINISVFAEFGEEDLYGGYFKPFKEYTSLIVAFKKVPERPAALSGFKVSKGEIWEILVVGKEQEDK
jgi:hypothetical protein